jgi:short-subunit dehydrogenase
MAPPVVVITGASTGIGRACAEAWATRAARLVLNARRVDELEHAAHACRMLGADTVVVPGDITSLAVQAAMVDGANEHFGRIDVLVNNAGVGLYGAIEAIEASILREVLELNVVAPVSLTRLALPALRQTRGTVVMMSSISGLVSMPRTGGYAASKFALEAISMSLRAELAAQKSGVRVCVVRPGITETAFADHARRAEGGDTRGENPLKAMSAQEVAEATLHAVEEGIPEIDLTAGGRAIIALARVSRPALRTLLARIAPRLGVK